MPTKVDDPRDIQGAVDRQFSNIVNDNFTSEDRQKHQDIIDAENRGSDASYTDQQNRSDSADASSNQVDTSEKSGAGDDAPWKNKYNSSKQTEDQGGSGKSKLAKMAKKGGPSMLLLSFLLGGAGIFSFFGGAGLLIVNFAEMLTSKFDYQTTTMTVRNNKIISSKLANTTTGSCGAVTFRCKFSTFSKTEIDNFKKVPGLTPIIDDSKSITGRTKITGFNFNGETIDARNFNQALRNNPAFANAMHGAYNMRFASKWDATWKKIEKKHGFSKKAPFDEGSDDEKRRNTIKETTKNGRIDTAANIGCAKPDQCTPDEVKANEEKAKGQAVAAGSTAEGPNAQSRAIASEVDASASAGSIASKSALNFVKITGPIDSACTVYSLLKTVSNVAKTIRVTQMVRYSMMFLTTASMIKAGTATAGDVAFIGTLLTQITVDSKGNKSKSATESFGYRYAAFGDKGKNSKAGFAVAGASFGGKIEQVINDVFNAVGGKKQLKETCTLLANPFVQGASVLVGLGSFLIGVGQIKTVIQSGFTIALGIAAPFLAAYLGELLAGDFVNDAMDGEDVGNYATSGVGAAMSQANAYGGGSTLTKEQATKVIEDHEIVTTDYARYDRSRLSPFDASSPNTFMGSMLTSFAPYIYSTNTPMAAIQNIGSLVTNSANNFISKPASAAGSLDECTDPEYEDLGMAADPFCNLITGIPSEYMGIDPIAVQESLQAQGLVDDNGKPTTSGTIASVGMSYPDFIAECMQRETAYGLGENDKSEACGIDSQEKANLYIHVVDNRIGDINETAPAGATGTDLTGTSGSGSAAGTTGPSVTLPEFCSTIAADDAGQIACKAYQFDEYLYEYGAGHVSSAADWMQKFKAGQISKGEPGVLDCSALVRMAIYDATGVDVGGISTSTIASNAHFQEIPQDQAKAGDIVVRAGSHTAVVVSNDVAGKKFHTYDAYGDEGIAPADQIKASTYDYSKMPKAYRVVK